MASAFRWFLALIFFVPLQVWAEPLRYEINGLDGDLKTNAKSYLETLPPIEAKDFKAVSYEIHGAISNSLIALGYYKPVISMALSKDKPDQLNIDIQPGHPVLVRSLNIDLQGDAADDGAFKRLLESFPIKEGDVLNHASYESGKSQLNDLSLVRGYFDNRMTKHSIHVYPDMNAADIHIVLESGTRYRFGDIHYGSMSDSTRTLINTMINFDRGKPYRSGKLSNLNRNLSATGYFREIDIRPLRDQAKDYEVPIYIGVFPKTAHELETGIGFSTDEGPRLSLSWDKPWLNDKGHSISNKLAISQINAEISSSYKIPAGNPLRDYYTLDVGYQKKTQDDTDSQRLTGAVHRWKKRPNQWDRDLFFRIEYEDFTQGEQTGHNLLLIPGIAFNRRKVFGRDGLDPQRGYLANVKLELSNRLWGSDTNFVKLWGRTKGLYTFREKHRFIGRAEQGGIWVSSVSDLPPSIRFFTGGDQSVRGYNFESISPKDSAGKLTGAKYLSAFSTEYDYEFIEKWRLALFVDAGTATNDYRDGWKVGSGFGIRWVTPLGPLKLDMAFALSEKDKPWRIHFTMGPDI